MIDHFQSSKSVLKGFFFGRNGWKSNLDGLDGANSPRLNYICKYIEMFKLIEKAFTFLDRLQIQAEFQITCTTTLADIWRCALAGRTRLVGFWSQFRLDPLSQGNVSYSGLQVVYQIRYTQSGNGNWHCPDCIILSHAYAHLRIHILYVYMQIVFHMYNYAPPPSLLDSYTQPISVYTGASCSQCQTC